MSKSKSVPCSSSASSGIKQQGKGNGNGNGKRLWKKVKYELVEYHSLPAYLKDNEYIKGHYRANWPLKQAFLSIFSLHNETLNVWTHLIGFFIFLYLTIYTANKVPKFTHLQNLPDVFRRIDLHQIHADILNCLPPFPDMSDLHKLRNELNSSLSSMDMIRLLSGWRNLEPFSNCLQELFSSANHTDMGLTNDITTTIISPLTQQPTPHWPLFAFLIGAMFCLLASTICHLLICHSERLSNMMLRLDYAGISSLIATSFYPVVYYSFMCHPLFIYLYMGSITIISTGTFLFTLFPAFQKPEFRTVRAVLFSVMGLLGILPIVHKNFLYSDKPAVIYSTAYEVLMGVFYGVGALVYASRIPERWLPGKFDIAGHSHQLFHVLVVAGAYTHYCGGLVYLQWRDLERCWIKL